MSIYIYKNWNWYMYVCAHIFTRICMYDYM